MSAGRSITYWSVDGELPDGECAVFSHCSAAMPRPRATRTSPAIQAMDRGQNRRATGGAGGDPDSGSRVVIPSKAARIDDSPHRGQMTRIPPTAEGRSVLQNGQVRDSAIIVPRRGVGSIVGT